MIRAANSRQVIDGVLARCVATAAEGIRFARMAPDEVALVAVNSALTQEGFRRPPARRFIPRWGRL